MTAVRSVLRGLAVILALTTACATRVAAEPVTFHGLEFPERFAGAERVSIQDYEKSRPGLGYSAGYRRGEMLTTVYIYDLGQTNIPAKLDTPPIKQQLERAKYELVQIQQQRGRLESRGEFRVADSRKQPRLMCVVFEHVRHDRQSFDKFACVGSAKGKFLKVRLTMPHRLGAVDEAKGFLKAWVDRLWPSAA